jgi:uncharacterized protein with PQ loop repeat
MVWQDILVAIANAVFIYAMIPQIIYGFKTKKGLISIQFSILNIFAMACLGFVYWSFDLPISIVLNITLILLWLILLTQRIKYGKVK